MVDKFFENDPFKSLYNLKDLNTVFLTTDIDWAPDYAIESLFELIESNNLKITAFATHKSDLLNQSSEFLEVGLHPDNTRPDLKYGFTKKISDLKDLYPDSVGLRCHRNFFGQNISDLALKSGIKYDMSTFMWKNLFLQVHSDYNGILKLPYYWEDGIHIDLDQPLDVSGVLSNYPGLKILNVHPMFLYLNAPSNALNKNPFRNIDDLTKVSKSYFEEFIFKGYGIRNLFEEVIFEINKKGIKTLHGRDVLKLNKF